MLAFIVDMEEALRLRLGTPGPFAPVFLFALGLAFGALHSLLPGHGKTVLAAVQLTGERSVSWPARMGRAARDAGLVSASRVGLSALLVLAGGAALSRWSLDETGVLSLNALVGAVLIALGARLVWRAARRASPASPSRARLPAFALAVLPDPVAVLLMSYAVVAGQAVLGLVALAGLACGMAVTLTGAGGLGLIARERVARLHARTGPALRAIAGLAIGAIGLSLIAATLW